MNKLRFLLTLLVVSLCSVHSARADVEINATNFPDENFRNWLLSQSYGSDGVITDVEIAGVTGIYVNSKSIASLKGIEFFTALTELDCQNNQLTALDVSMNTALNYLYCDYNQLTALDVSMNTALNYLYCYNNQLTALDVTKNTALTSLSCYNNQLTTLDVTKNTALTGLSCYGNRLTALDVTKNTALWILYCHDNQLSALDVSKNTKLEYLGCGNNQLTTLDVTKNTALTSLSCYGNQLTALDVSKNTALWNLDCYQNQIKGEAMDALIASLPTTVSDSYLNVIYNTNEGNVMTTTQVAAAKTKGWTPRYWDTTENAWLEYTGSGPIEINATNFPDENFRNWLLSQSYGSDGVITDVEIAGVTGINVSSKSIASLKGIEFFTALTDLRCYKNSLTLLDVSKNTALEWLECSNNPLTSLDVSKNTALEYLICYNNQLTALDVSKNTALTRLRCGYNQLTSLDVSKNTALTDLDCYTNQLTALDVSKNAALRILECYNNQLTALDVSENTALTSLQCYTNQLTALDVSKSTALEYLTCYNNQLTTLDVSKNTALTSLQCYTNQLTTLDVTKNTALIYLGCDNNQLTALDVSKNTALTSLGCDNNQLTTLDVTKNTKLEYLGCGNNQLTTLDVTKNTALTSLSCYGNQLTALDVSKNTALEKLYCHKNQIKGEAMDALVASLRTFSTDRHGYMYVIYFEYEGNVMTTTQVAAAKTKGWTPRYWDTTENAWLEYTGSGPIEINATNYPDENFRNWLLSQSYGSDGVITDVEIAGVTGINVSSKSIASLKGIEFFTALRELLCNGNQLTSLDVTKNTALTKLSCENNQLTTLDVTKNTALTSLSCYGNQLTALDVSKNTALTDLDCHQNQIKGEAMDALIASLPTTVSNSYLNVIYNTNEGNVMTTTQVAAAKTKGWTPRYWDTTENAWLEYAGSEPEAIIEINATNFPDENFRNYLLGRKFGSDGVITAEEIAGITSMSVSRLNITSLKGIEFFTALTRLVCSSNQLTTLDVSKNTALTSLQCYTNQLTTLDVTKNTALIYLGCDNNQLTALDVSKNTALTELDCGYNQLTALDVSKNTALRTLWCYNNQLTTLDVSKNTALIGLSCSSNRIKGTSMDALIASLPTTVSDSYLNVIYNTNEGNVMTTTQVAAAKAKGWTPRYWDTTESAWLEYAGSDAAAGVEINETNFPDENFRNYLLRQSYGSDGVLTDEEIAGITILAIRWGNIASLKGIEFFTALETLDCRINQLTSLNVSKNTALTTLYCSANQLTALDVSGCTALNYLDCFNNKLTALDVSGCTALETLICDMNQIKGTAMDALIKSLPATTGKLYIIWLSGNEDNVMTKAQVAAAKAKGWTPFGVGVSLQGQEVVKEYIGSDPAAIEPIAEETTVSFGGTSGVDESTDLSNTAVNDVLYTLDTTAGNGYDNTDQSITIASVVSDADITEAESLTPGTPEFAAKFNGITIELAAGEGSVTFDCQTIGNRLLTVKMGNAPAATYTKSERGEVKVAYNVTAPTYMYVYATAVAGSRGSEPTAIENALKLYSFTVKPGGATAIEAVESDALDNKDGSDIYFDLSGRRVMAPTKGIYVKNGRKVAIK